MARKKGGGHGGGHGWFVTFADLMGLLMSFFVMLCASSTQDQKKLQIVAGSMRDAFGTQKISRLSGIVERDGLPVRPHLRHVERISPDKASDVTAARQKTDHPVTQADMVADRASAMAAATLRQALQDFPEISETSKNVMVEETSEGLDVQIVDQDGRAMFGEGESRPMPRARAILERLAPRIAALGNPIRITGHASGGRPASAEADGWRISSERALAIRTLLERGGVATTRFESVVGKADTDPMFPDDPRVSANRRVSILLVKVAQPLPPR